MKKSILLSLSVLLFTVTLLCGCQKQEEESGKLNIDLFYLNKEETRIDKEAYTVQAEELKQRIKEVLQAMAKAPENAEDKAVISSNFTVLDASLDGEQLILTVDEHYKELSPSTEVLTRAAFVRSLTQLPGVKYVSMKVRNEVLTDTTGNPVGIMAPEMFIDNAGDEINAYEKVKLKLYFADESGKKLVEASRTVVYNSNISMEKLVVEQLIGGPNSKEIFPTMNPETKIISVTVKDGICYVNLDESFLTQIYNVTSEVTIYSITNSLVELPNVNKVQISINGDTSGTYRETIPFATIFERNFELMKTGETNY